MSTVWLGDPPGEMRLVLGPRELTADVISKGCISASDRNIVREMPTIPPGQNSARLVARDVLGKRYEFTYKKRRYRPVRPYDKQTINGLKTFFEDHDLEAGDRIFIYKMSDEDAGYYIHFKRAVRGEGGF